MTVERSLSLDSTHQRLDSLPRHRLRHAYYREDAGEGGVPDVRFAMACDDDSLFLKFYVREACVLARAVRDNESVCKDSCVEFFVNPAPSKNVYWNFEFNCIGTCLAARGKDRHSRTPLADAALASIARCSSFPRKPFAEKHGDIQWWLAVRIPLALFCDAGAGTEWTGNIYKCADDSSRPHWLSWHKMDVTRPDFHRPEYFGPIRPPHTG